GAVRAQPEAPDVQEEYGKATVTKIIGSGSSTDHAIRSNYQDIEARIIDGPEEGKILRIRHSGIARPNGPESLSQGDTIIIQKTISAGETTYSVLDKYRLDVVLAILLGFFLFIILIAGKRGVGSILGMLV